LERDRDPGHNSYRKSYLLHRFARNCALNVLSFVDILQLEIDIIPHFGLATGGCIMDGMLREMELGLSWIDGA
jgi:hypothetical protein